MLSSRLLFGDWITLTIEAYLEFCIAGYLVISNPKFAIYGDFMSFSFGVCALLLALVFLPGLIMLTYNMR